MTTVATEIGISRSSSTKSYINGRITKIPEFYFRYDRETKAYRGSEHYFGTLRQSTGIAKWSNLYERISGFFKMLNQFAVEIPSLPVDQCHSHFIQYLKECWDILSYRRAAEKAGERFWRSRYVIISTLTSRIASLDFINRRATPFVHSGEKWKARTKSGSEMPDWTISQRFGHPQWKRLFKELWCRPSTIAVFGSSLRQVPNTSYVCLLEDKTQHRFMYLFTIPYGSYAMEQRSRDGRLSGWFKIFIINTRYFNAELWCTWCEHCFSAEQNHP